MAETISKEIKKAVPEVISHWVENLKSAKAGTLKMEDIKWPKCSLCKIFFIVAEKRCFPKEDIFCPIKGGSRKICCHEWRMVYKALCNFLESSSLDGKKAALVQAVEGMLKRVKKLKSE